MSVSKLISEGRKLLDAGKYDEAIKKLNEALNGILIKKNNINNQIDAQSWLRICYLKQSIENPHIQNTDELFSRAVEDYKKLFTSFEKLIVKKKDIKNQIEALSELVQCYFYKAMSVTDIEDVDQLFTKAIKYSQEWLALAENLDKNRDPIDSKINAEYWLGQCYFQQAFNNQNAKIADQFFVKAIAHYTKQKSLAESLSREEYLDVKETTAYWLGKIHLEYAIKTKDTKNAAELFQLAIQHFQELSNASSYQDKIYAQHGLGRCYFEQAIKIANTDTENANNLLESAIKYYEKQLNFAKKWNQLPYKREEFQANFELGRCYLEKHKIKNIISEKEQDDIKKYFERATYLCDELPAKLFGEKFKENQITAIKQYKKELEFILKNYKKYFDLKKEYIQDHLQLNQEYLKLNNSLKEAVTSILAVLSISPIEFKKPLAHYTSPFVCERLLGIKQNEEKQSEIKPSKMRMNSSTYMNDPYEGKSLLDFLGIQENSLENKTEFSSHNAFFACFSARVNDLNQFRLYGKVSGVEASGCCLVFNKRKNWVKEPDISASYQRLNDKNSLENQETIKNTATTQRPPEDLPLYQVAYIFYRDEYTKQDEYDVFGDIPEEEKPSFGIRLKPISNDKEWHKERENQLKNALIALQKYFKSNDKTEEQKQTDQSVLEYIRYLFKDYAFRDEEEFRLLQIEELGSKKVQYCHETNSAYVEYVDICDKLDEVILGTNYERAGGEQKVEAFRHLLKKKLPHIKVSHSSLPINAAQVVRKP